MAGHPPPDPAAGSGRRAPVASPLPVNAKLAMSQSTRTRAPRRCWRTARHVRPTRLSPKPGGGLDAEGFAGLLAAAQSRLGRNAASVVQCRRPGTHRGAGGGRARRGGEPGTRYRAGHRRHARPACRAHLPGIRRRYRLRRLPDLVRYLRAISRRLEKAPADPGRDADRMAVVHRVADAYQRAVGDKAYPGPVCADARAGLRWMIEALRVALFAQPPGHARLRLRAADPGGPGQAGQLSQRPEE